MWMLLWLALIVFVCALPQPSPEQSEQAWRVVTPTKSSETSFAIDGVTESSDLYYRQYINMAYFKNSPTCSEGNAVYSVTQSDYHECRPTSLNTVTPNGAIANSFTMLISSDCQQYRAVYYANELCTGAEAWRDPVIKQLELDDWPTSCEVVDDLADSSMTRKLTCGRTKVGPEILKKTEYFTNMVYEDGNLDCGGVPTRETNYVANDCIATGSNSMKWTRDGNIVYRTEYKGDSSCDGSRSEVELIAEVENSIGNCGASVKSGDFGYVSHSELGSYTASLSKVLFQKGIVRSTTITINASQKIAGTDMKEKGVNIEIFKQAVRAIIVGQSSTESNTVTVTVTNVRFHNNSARSLRSRSPHTNAYANNANTNANNVNAYANTDGIDGTGTVNTNSRGYADTYAVLGVDTNPAVPDDSLIDYEQPSYVQVDFTILLEVSDDETAESVFSSARWSLDRVTRDDDGAAFITAFTTAAEGLGMRGAGLASLRREVDAWDVVSPVEVSEKYEIETEDVILEAASGGSSGISSGSSGISISSSSSSSGSRSSNSGSSSDAGVSEEKDRHKREEETETAETWPWQGSFLFRPVLYMLDTGGVYATEGVEWLGWIRGVRYTTIVPLCIAIALLLYVVVTSRGGGLRQAAEKKQPAKRVVVDKGRPKFSPGELMISSEAIPECSSPCDSPCDSSPLSKVHVIDIAQTPGFEGKKSLSRARMVQMFELDHTALTEPFEQSYILVEYGSSVGYEYGSSVGEGNPFVESIDRLAVVSTSLS